MLSRIFRFAGNLSCVSSASSDSARLSYEDLEALVVELRAQNVALTLRIEELERQSNRNSRNHEFDGSEAPVGDPVIHQQWELPPVRPLVFSVRPDPVALSVLRAAETGGSARGGVVVGVRAPA